MTPTEIRELTEALRREIAALPPENEDSRSENTLRAENSELRAEVARASAATGPGQFDELQAVLRSRRLRGKLLRPPARPRHIHQLGRRTGDVVQ